MLIKLQGKLAEKKEIKEFKRRSFFEQFLWDGRLLSTLHLMNE